MAASNSRRSKAGGSHAMDSGRGAQYPGCRRRSRATRFLRCKKRCLRLGRRRYPLQTGHRSAPAQPAGHAEPAVEHRTLYTGSLIDEGERPWAMKA
jgi:hypothetical protein